MMIFWLIEAAVLAVVGAALVGLSFFIRQRFYWRRRGVPHHHAMPLIGHNWPIFSKKVPFSDYVEYQYRLHPGASYHGTFDFDTPVIMLKDPELIREICVKSFEHFTDHKRFVSVDTDPIVANNVLLLEGQRWRDVRSMLSPSFTANRMKALFGLIDECSKAFVRYFLDNPSIAECFEAKDVFTRYTNDVIATAAFGIEVDSLKNPQNEFYLHGKDATNFNGFRRFFRFMLLRSYPTIARILGLTFMSKNTNRFFEQLVSNVVKTREEKGIIRPDMIHLMIEARAKENGIELSINDIVGQAFIFFLAGFDTVSTVMYFLAYVLATHPEIQEKVQREIDEHLEQDSSELTYDSLGRMKYLDMVVNETLRLYPPVPITDRICVKEFTLPPAAKGYRECRLELKTSILLPVFGLHRDPQYFENPETFIPERFDDNNKNSIHPYAYIPFGTGPRKCIGNRFALMEIKVLFVRMMKNFNLKLDKRTKYPAAFSKTPFKVEIDGGCWLRLEPRKKTD